MNQDTSAYRPFVREGMFNGNAAIDFDGVNDSMEYIGTLLTGDADATIIAVARDEALDATYGSLWSFGSNGEDPTLYAYNDTLVIEHDSSTPTTRTSARSIEEDQTYVIDMSWEIGTNTNTTIGIDGINETFAIFDVPNVESVFNIGGGTDQNNGWDGEIAEVLVFDTVLSGADLQKVHSYLAVKYGTTYAGGAADYLDTIGATVWDATANAGYANDIAGIGRDDTTALLQTRSQSANADATVTMSLRNVSGLDNRDYMMRGNDSGSLTGTISASLPAIVSERVERVWRVDESNSVVAVDVIADMSTTSFNDQIANKIYLLVSSTTDFSASTVYTGLFIAGGQVNFGQVDFTDGDYFTFAQ